MHEKLEPHIHSSYTLSTSSLHLRGWRCLPIGKAMRIVCEASAAQLLPSGFEIAKQVFCVCPLKACLSERLTSVICMVLLRASLHCPNDQG